METPSPRTDAPTIFDPEPFIDQFKTKTKANDHKVEQLKTLMKDNGVVIAGGSVTKAYSGYKQKVKDYDFYVNLRNFNNFFTGMKEILKGHADNSHLAPQYDQSFFRKNHILVRFTTVSNIIGRFSTPIDVMVVDDRFSVIDVVNNFDLSFCEIWYDGVEVKTHYADHILHKNGILKPDYVEAFVSRINGFIKRRIDKYSKRGFTISYDNQNTQRVFFNTIKSKNVTSPEEWVYSTIYQIFIKMKYNSANVFAMTYPSSFSREGIIESIQKFNDSTATNLINVYEDLFNSMGFLDLEKTILDDIVVNLFLTDITPKDIMVAISRIFMEIFIFGEYEGIIKLDSEGPDYIGYIKEQFLGILGEEYFADMKRLYVNPSLREHFYRTGVLEIPLEELSLLDEINSIEPTDLEGCVLVDLPENFSVFVSSIPGYVDAKEFLEEDMGNIIIVNLSPNGLYEGWGVNLSQIEDSDGTLIKDNSLVVECKEIGELSVNINNIKRGKYYFRSSFDTVNSGLLLNHTRGIIKEMQENGIRYFIVKDRKVISPVAAIETISVERGTDLYSRQIDVMSAYHCQEGSSLPIYETVKKVVFNLPRGDLTSEELFERLAEYDNLCWIAPSSLDDMIAQHQRNEYYNDVQRQNDIVVEVEEEESNLVEAITMKREILIDDVEDHYGTHLASYTDIVRSKLEIWEVASGYILKEFRSNNDAGYILIQPLNFNTIEEVTDKYNNIIFIKEGLGYTNET
jgi:hypothetical protein